VDTFSNERLFQSFRTMECSLRIFLGYDECGVKCTGDYFRRDDWRACQ